MILNKTFCQLPPAAAFLNFWVFHPCQPPFHPSDGLPPRPKAQFSLLRAMAHSVTFSSSQLKSSHWSSFRTGWMSSPPSGAKLPKHLVGGSIRTSHESECVSTTLPLPFRKTRKTGAHGWGERMTLGFHHGEEGFRFPSSGTFRTTTCVWYCA